MGKMVILYALLHCMDNLFPFHSPHWSDIFFLSTMDACYAYNVHDLVPEINEILLAYEVVK